MKKKYLPLDTISIVLIIGLMWLVLGIACRKSTIEEPIAKGIVFEVPQGWPTPVYNFENNPLNQTKFDLGRKLFYDKRLSIDNSISCGSCHQQFAGFSNLDHPVSHGVFDRIGIRNSPGLFNLNWHTSFFWDGGVNHLEVQPLNPILNHDEMAETLEGVVAKLEQDVTYVDMFSKAFGESGINSAKIFKSLAVFMGMMVSDQSKYDQYQRGEMSLTAAEMSGKALYENHCATCHAGPLFSDFSFRNNGLPVIPNAQGNVDSGRARIDKRASSLFLFKVPSLRNLKFTPPYMHDGRFDDLEQVLDHYETINPQTVNLDPILSNGIHLSATERADLLAFLNTLNDEVFVKNKRFAEHP